MTYPEFQSLCKADQIKVVIEHLPIAVRGDADFTVLLNKIDDFFVEVYFDMTATKGLSIKVVDSFKSLEPYWEPLALKEINDLPC